MECGRTGEDHHERGQEEQEESDNGQSGSDAQVLRAGSGFGLGEGNLFFGDRFGIVADAFDQFADGPFGHESS